MSGSGLLGDLAALVPEAPKITEVLPLLYLHGLSSGDFVPALGRLPGRLSGAVGGGDRELTNLEGRRRAFAARDLSGADYVYVSADGDHVNIRLEAPSCACSC